MSDPLGDIVGLLQPSLQFSKIVRGGGRWGVRPPVEGQASYMAILEGQCLMTVGDLGPLLLEAGDFVLVPTALGGTVSSVEPARTTAVVAPPAWTAGRIPTNPAHFNGF